nr:hypothetical protein [uncultured Desulfobacter sp.]
MDANKLAEIIGAAIRAPSGDNCQPWRFEVYKNTIRIDVIQEYAKSFFDFELRGTFLSIGCVLHNIQIQAAYGGIKAEFSDVVWNGPNTPSIKVTFSESPNIQVSSDVIHALYTRTVNRRPFYPSRIQNNVLDNVLGNKRRGSDVDGVRIHCFESRKQIAKWAKVVYLTDRIRYSHPVIHGEVFGKILLTKEEAKKKRIGLEINRLGIGPLSKYVIQLLKPWERMKKLSKIGVDRILAWQSQFLMKMCGAVILVTVDDNSPESWIKAGQEIQRMLIAAQKFNLCVQPMTVGLYLNARYNKEGSANFLSQHIPLLNEIGLELKNLIPSGIGTMLFRIGYGPMMKTPAIRRQLEDFMRAKTTY